MMFSAIVALMLGTVIGGQPLRPAATVTNDTGAPLFVVLPLEPDAAFTNTTDRTFSVLDALELRSLADLRIEEHEDTIDRLEARLVEIDRALADYRAERSTRAGTAP